MQRQRKLSDGLQSIRLPLDQYKAEAPGVILLLSLRTCLAAPLPQAPFLVLSTALRRPVLSAEYQSCSSITGDEVKRRPTHSAVTKPHLADLKARKGVSARGRRQERSRQRERPGSLRDST